MARAHTTPRAKRDLEDCAIYLAENHLVFYLSRGDRIEIVRVLHGARDLEAIFDGPEGESE